MKCENRSTSLFRTKKAAPKLVWGGCRGCGSNVGWLRDGTASPRLSWSGLDHVFEAFEGRHFDFDAFRLGRAVFVLTLQVIEDVFLRGTSGNDPLGDL